MNVPSKMNDLRYFYVFICWFKRKQVILQNKQLAKRKKIIFQLLNIIQNYGY